MFALNFKRLRTKAGFTQEYLAEKLGISTRYLQVIESGSVWPSPKSIKKFAKALSCEETDFYSPLKK